MKIYTGQKNLHEYIRGVRDKYEVCAGAVVPAWWFHDPPLLGVVSQRLGELAALLGQYQALLQKVEVVPSELDLHCLEAAPKAILTSDLGEACEQDACYKRRSL